MTFRITYTDSDGQRRSVERELLGDAMDTMAALRATGATELSVDRIRDIAAAADERAVKPPRGTGWCWGGGQ